MLKGLFKNALRPLLEDMLLECIQEITVDLLGDSVGDMGITGADIPIPSNDGLLANPFAQGPHAGAYMGRFEEESSSESAAAVEAPAPVKRGRGRPPKVRESRDAAGDGGPAPDEADKLGDGDDAARRAAHPPEKVPEEHKPDPEGASLADRMAVVAANSGATQEQLARIEAEKAALQADIERQRAEDAKAFNEGTAADTPKPETKPADARYAVTMEMIHKLLTGHTEFRAPTSAWMKAQGMPLLKEMEENSPQMIAVYNHINKLILDAM